MKWSGRFLVTSKHARAVHVIANVRFRFAEMRPSRRDAGTGPQRSSHNRRKPRSLFEFGPLRWRRARAGIMQFTLSGATEALAEAHALRHCGHLGFTICTDDQWDVLVGDIIHDVRR